MEKTWHGEEEWVGEEVEDGQAHGRVEAHSVTYHHGNDQDGSTAEDLEEASDGGLETHMFAQDFHGFQDGGGLTRRTPMVLDTDTRIRIRMPILVIREVHTHIMDMVTAMVIHTTLIQRTRRILVIQPIHGIGEGGEKYGSSAAKN